MLIIKCIIENTLINNSHYQVSNHYTNCIAVLSYDQLITFVYISIVISTWLWIVLWGHHSNDGTMWQECCSSIRLSWEHHCLCSTLTKMPLCGTFLHVRTIFATLLSVVTAAVQLWMCQCSSDNAGRFLVAVAIFCFIGKERGVHVFVSSFWSSAEKLHPVVGAAATSWIRHMVCDGMLWVCVVSYAALLFKFANIQDRRWKKKRLHLYLKEWTEFPFLLRTYLDVNDRRLCPNQSLLLPVGWTNVSFPFPLLRAELGLRLCELHWPQGCRESYQHSEWIETSNQNNKSMFTFFLNLLVEKGGICLFVCFLGLFAVLFHLGLRNTSLGA